MSGKPRYIFEPPHFDEYQETLFALSLEAKPNQPYNFGVPRAKRLCLYCGQPTRLFPNGFHYRCIRKWLQNGLLKQKEQEI